MVSLVVLTTGLSYVLAKLSFSQILHSKFQLVRQLKSQLCYTTKLLERFEQLAMLMWSGNGWSSSRFLRQRAGLGYALSPHHTHTTNTTAADKGQTAVILVM
jgi:hypothetical protein